MLPARDELPQLEELRKRAQANRLAGVRLIRPEHLCEIEPHANGLGALLVRSTGVTEFWAHLRKVCEHNHRQWRKSSHTRRAKRIKRSSTKIVLEILRAAFSTNFLINCAKLYSDRISRMLGDDRRVMVAPFVANTMIWLPTVHRSSAPSYILYPIAVSILGCALHASNQR
jgi:(S)-2-hydroxyglutarate dehydrogenase